MPDSFAADTCLSLIHRVRSQSDHHRRPPPMRILQSDRTQPVAGVGFTPDGRLVAGGSGGFDLYDLTTLRHFSVPLAESKYVFAFVVDSLGRWLYLSMGGYGCRIHDPTSGAVRSFPGVEGEHVVGLAASADRRRVPLN